MSFESEPRQETNEVPQTPSQKLDSYVASLDNRTDYDVMEDRMHILTVKRNPDATHDEPWPDSGWMLTTTGVDKKGVTVGIVEKLLHPDDEAPARKRVVLDEAFRYSAEVARARAPQTELADSAFRVTGPANPSMIEPFNDPFSNAMTGEQARAIIASRGNQAEASVEVPVKEETEREMLDRHIREYQAEKSELYAQLRKTEQGSDEYYTLVNQINQTKQDIERVDKKRRGLGYN